MISLNDKGKITLIKGSPEKILQKCETYYDEFCIKRPFIKKDNYIQRMNSYSKRGIRLLALATKEAEKKN